MTPRLLPSALALLLALAASASAVLFGVDAFDYPDGALAGQAGGVSWDRTNAPFFSASGGASNWDNVTGAPTVLLGRLVTNGSSAKREYKGSPEGDGAFNDGTHAKAVYYRTTVTTGPVLPEFFGMSSYDFTNERVFFGKRFGQPNFAVVNSVTGAFNDSSIAVQPNTTYVLVARVDYAADTIRLYVNPNLTAAEPASASASLPWTNAEWSTAVRLASGNTGSGVTWDDITVATSWSDLALVVNTFLDEDSGSLGGAQSLRECLKYGPKGAMILFHPGLDGFTLSLSAALGELVVAAGQDFIVDASALANGSTIDDGASDSFRLLRVDSGARLEVRGVTLSDAGASTGSLDGGAVRNAGTLTLTRCTLAFNSAGAGSGGAVYSTGSLLANQCTFARNSAASGGAVESAGDSRLVHCTLAGNTAAAFGGAVRNSQFATALLHCTIAENSAGNSGGGVASVGDNLTQTIVRNSIVAGNVGGDVEFIAGALNSFTSQGSNLIGTGNALGDFNQPSDIINRLDPLLLPFGRYGGRTSTMPPLAGSPAIDTANGIANLDADQRGLARSRDGNNNGVAVPDRGATEAAFRFVANANDLGAGSLRQTLADAAAAPGRDAIAFGAPLNAGTISLTTSASGSALSVNDTDGVAIDATALPGGLTITKPAGNYRLFNVGPALGASLGLHGLTLAGGGAGGASGLSGGAISNNGILTLTRCTFSGNRADARGGAIYDAGFLFYATHCTFSDNRANGSGGAISTAGNACTMAHCTFTDNQAFQGAIYLSGGELDLTHCTIAANEGGFVGGIYADIATLRITNCIVAGNDAGGTPLDIEVDGGELAYSGANIVGTAQLAGSTSSGPAPISADPLLAPLGAYGGRTQTMPPRLGSPALDATAVTLFATDQRGRPRPRDGDADGLAAPDLGAVEASIFAGRTIWTPARARCGRRSPMPPPRPARTRSSFPSRSAAAPSRSPRRRAARRSR